MKIFPTIAFLTAGLFLLTNTVQAESRTCRVVYPERPRDAPKIAYLFDGEKSQSVSLPSMNLSEVIELPDGPLTLAMTSNEITNPEALPANMPMIKIPESVTNFYILITADPKNKDLPVKMNLVATSGGKLKQGETLWFNLTNHRIVAKLGSANMSVDPKGRTITKDPAPKSAYYVARLAYQAEGKGAYAPITEQSWWHDANSRHLGFIVNKGGKLPKIYFYRDFRLPSAISP